MAVGFARERMGFNILTRVTYAEIYHVLSETNYTMIVCSFSCSTRITLDHSSRKDFEQGTPFALITVSIDVWQEERGLPVVRRRDNTIFEVCSCAQPHF